MMDLGRAAFMGYRREDGTVGVRNYLGVISTVTCANQAALDIARNIDGSALFTHQQGCGLTQDDLRLVERSLTNLGCNPNLGAVLVVSLGCEGVDAERIAQGIAESGKPVDTIEIQAQGGYFQALREAGLKAQSLSMAVSRVHPEKVDIDELRVGVKCGASDPTSGLASNPAVGVAVDLLIEAGGSAVFGETTELVGAEHVLTQRCANHEVADKLLAHIEALERRVLNSGSDIRGGNPSAGNIAAGLTTLEEKSLGAVVKAGIKEIRDVFDYGECPPWETGLYFVDSPGREPEILAALAAAGCQVMLFSTGIGAPQGFPFVPVLKISGNRNTVVNLSDFIDIDVSGVILGRQTLAQAGEAVLMETLKVCSGSRTKAEAIGYVGSTALYQTGPIV
jgi:altronate dehydratase large subunit